MDEQDITLGYPQTGNAKAWEVVDAAVMQLNLAFPGSLWTIVWSPGATIDKEPKPMHS